MESKSLKFREFGPKKMKTCKENIRQYWKSPWKLDVMRKLSTDFKMSSFFNSMNFGKSPLVCWFILLPHTAAVGSGRQQHVSPHGCRMLCLRQWWPGADCWTGTQVADILPSNVVWRTIQIIRPGARDESRGKPGSATNYSWDLGRDIYPLGTPAMDLEHEASSIGTL